MRGWIMGQHSEQSRRALVIIELTQIEDANARVDEANSVTRNSFARMGFFDNWKQVAGGGASRVDVLCCIYSGAFGAHLTDLPIDHFVKLCRFVH